MTSKRLKGPEVGDVYAIPLPDGRFAFARMYLKSKFGIFAFVSSRMEAPQEVILHPVLFWTGCYEDPTKSGLWPYLGRMPFKSIDDAWPPGIYTRNWADPRFCMLYVRNESWSVRPEDLDGLEPILMRSVKAVMERIQHQIIDRKPWDIKAHCPYHDQLRTAYGPDYERVIAEKFQNVPWDPSNPVPGTLVDTYKLEYYLKKDKGKEITIELLTQSAVRRMDEIEDCLDELLVAEDLGGVIGTGRLTEPVPGTPLGDIQLKVYHQAKAMKVIKMLLKEKGLSKATVISINKD